MAPTPEQIDELAAALFHSYSAGVGGLTHDGRPIPSWGEIVNGGSRVPDGWRAAAAHAIERLTAQPTLVGVEVLPEGGLRLLLDEGRHVDADGDILRALRTGGTVADVVDGPDGEAYLHLEGGAILPLPADRARKVRDKVVEREAREGGGGPGGGRAPERGGA